MHKLMQRRLLKSKAKYSRKIQGSDSSRDMIIDPKYCSFVLLWALTVNIVSRTKMTENKNDPWQQEINLLLGNVWIKLIATKILLVLQNASTVVSLEQHAICLWQSRWPKGSNETIIQSLQASCAQSLVPALEGVAGLFRIKGWTLSLGASLKLFQKLFHFRRVGRPNKFYAAGSSTYSPHPYCTAQSGGSGHLWQSHFSLQCLASSSTYSDLALVYCMQLIEGGLLPGAKETAEVW